MFFKALFYERSTVIFIGSRKGIVLLVRKKCHYNAGFYYFLDKKYNYLMFTI